MWVVLAFIFSNLFNFVLGWFIGLYNCRQVMQNEQKEKSSQK